VVRFDDMSVSEWLTMSRWNAEMSGSMPIVGERMTPGELAWSLIEQAASEFALQQGQHAVSFAA
jgi:hypothetical protein